MMFQNGNISIIGTQCLLLKVFFQNGQTTEIRREL